MFCNVVWFKNDVNRHLREELACVHSYCRASSIQMKITKGHYPYATCAEGIIHAHYNFDILHTTKIPWVRLIYGEWTLSQIVWLIFIFLIFLCLLRNCDFERKTEGDTGKCKWLDVQDDDLIGQFTQEKTPSAGTGPTSDHTLSKGTYWYVRIIFLNWCYIIRNTTSLFISLQVREGVRKKANTFTSKVLLHVHWGKKPCFVSNLRAGLSAWGSGITCMAILDHWQLCGLWRRKKMTIYQRERTLRRNYTASGKDLT